MSLLVATEVWTRVSVGREPMSKRVFVVMLAFWTAFGIGISAAASAFSRDWQPSLKLLLGVLLVSLLGAIITNKSRRPAVLLLGYLLITIPLGLLCGPLVAKHADASLFKILGITAGMVVGLGIIGALWPRSLESWAVWLFVALLVLLVASLAMLTGLFGTPTEGMLQMWDWVGIGLFSLYVIYELNRAMRIERTHGNAIDVAISVYLDFANIFIRLLE